MKYLVKMKRVFGELIIQLPTSNNVLTCRNRIPLLNIVDNLP